ncbi:glycosyltransferase [Micromonospora sp. NPDC049523]|uniref:glycosyltransferase n=1 Tax=Micromonospora sp. NPDC049523 TaxID=3155921 RepID=UPI0034142DA1
MTDALECSVIVSTYNREEMLRHTLESLTRQNLPLDRFEVLVIDDGSSDGTRSLVETFSDRLNLRYFFQPDEGWRVAKARNVGIRNARSERCVFVDAGVLLHSGCVAAHVAALDSVTGPVAVTGYVYCFDVTDEDAEQMRKDIDVRDPDATIARFAAEQRWLDLREIFYEQHTDEFNDLPAPWVIWWTCNVSARTAELREVGLFDEVFQSWGGEDIDLAYRLHRAGARFVLARDASAIHYPHHKDFDKNEEAAAGNYQYIARKYGTPIAALMQGSPDIHPFNINDIIVERGLPSCADYLAQGVSR